MSGRIKKSELIRMVKEEKTGQEIAKHFNVSGAAVSKAKRALTDEKAKYIAWQHAEEIIDEEMDTVEDLKRLSWEVKEIISSLTGKEDIKDKLTLIKALAELRKQINLRLDVLKSLADYQRVLDWQKEILSIIKEESPELQERIIARVKRAKSLRSISKPG